MSQADQADRIWGAGGPNFRKIPGFWPNLDPRRTEISAWDLLPEKPPKLSDLHLYTGGNRGVKWVTFGGQIPQNFRNFARFSRNFRKISGILAKFGQKWTKIDPRNPAPTLTRLQNSTSPRGSFLGDFPENVRQAGDRNFRPVTQLCTHPPKMKDLHLYTDLFGGKNGGILGHFFRKISRILHKICQNFPKICAFFPLSKKLFTRLHEIPLWPL